MTTPPPILFLHGVFGSPGLLGPWTRRLEAAGHRVHAPAMPGRDPGDCSVLARTGIEDCVDVASTAYDDIGEPAVVIGHSMGGLLAQRVAAVRDPIAVVLLASVPPGVLWPQLRSVPHLAPIMRDILAGRPFRPSDRTMRKVPLNTLGVDEQDVLLSTMVHDSGRVFRELSVGARSTRVDVNAVTCPVLCVSAGADRNVAPWISRRLASRYGATHHVHAGAPHWIIAESLADDVCPPVLDWLRRAATPSGRSAYSSHPGRTR